MKPAAPMLSRQAPYRFAWILFIVSIILPAPAGSFQGGAFGISALYVIAKTIEWSNAFPRFTDGLNFSSLVLLTLALFSNVVFLFTPGLRKCRNISTASKLLLLALLAINASLMFCIPLFAKLPAYGLWLAAFAVLTFAFIVLSGAGATPPKPTGKRAAPRAAIVERGEVPALIWAWLACTVFWLGVTAINYTHPTQQPVRAAAPASAALSSYVTDTAGLLPAASLERLQRELEQFEQQTSNQIAVISICANLRTQLLPFKNGSLSTITLIGRHTLLHRTLKFRQKIYTEAKNPSGKQH